MYRIIILSLSILLTIQSYALASVIEPARVSLVYGDVMFRTPDADEWEPALINTPLDEGDEFWCPDGTKAEIQLPDGSIVRLDGGSQLNLLANETDFIQLHLASGRLYVRTSSTSRENSLQIDADDTTVLPSPRTRLRLDMQSNGQEDVSIFKGSAYVEGNGSRTKVRAGEHIALEEDYSELLPLNAPDSWESWNVERDRAQSIAAQVVSSLPDELRSYSGELEANGSWVNTTEYGMVWRPTVVVSNEWVPYRSGRWIWRGADYIWISSESWGWVPYHYGRWTVIGRFGWCWIPPARGDVYWGPGYVGWYRSGSHVGWTPLAPGETYYGYGNHGRHSVNISTTTVNIKSIDYRNRRYRGGQTIVPQKDFLRGRSPISQPVKNSLVSAPVSIGSPRIKPSKEPRTSTGRPNLPRQVSPRREQQNISELRQRFPRVTPAPAPRQKNKQTQPVTAPQQRQQLQDQTSAPVKHQQTTIKQEERSRQQSEPAPRLQHQQTPTVSVPEQRQPSQRVNTPQVVNHESNGKQGEKSRQGSPQKVQKQKKIWRVKTEESAVEKVPKILENKNKERKEKQ